MKRTGSVLAAAALLTGLWAEAAFSRYILSCPTANQQKAGQIRLCFSAVDPHNSSPQAPSHVNCYRAYMGITDQVEIDAYVRAPNHARPSRTYWHATLLVLEEARANPAVVLGVSDIGRDWVYSAGARAGHRAERAFFMAAAKTVNPPAGGQKPEFPIVRLHLGAGTERHSGVFGGVQMKLNPKVGAVVLLLQDDALFAPDDHDSIYALMYTPGPQWPTFRIAKCGQKDVIGLSYDFLAR